MTQKFFIDENLPVSLAEELALLGFDAEHARNAGKIGATDKEIAHHSKKERAILITRDLQFGNLLFYPPGAHYGVIIVRLPYTATARELNAAICQLLLSIRAEDLVGAITVLEIGRYRIRKMPRET